MACTRSSVVDVAMLILHTIPKRLVVKHHCASSTSSVSSHLITGYRTTVSSMPALGSNVTDERLDKAGPVRFAVDLNSTSGFGQSDGFTNELTAPTHSPSKLSNIAPSGSKVSRPSAITIMNVPVVIAPEVSSMFLSWVCDLVLPVQVNQPVQHSPSALTIVCHRIPCRSPVSMS